jgi:hypothetical protein
MGFLAFEVLSIDVVPVCIVNVSIGNPIPNSEKQNRLFTFTD